MTKILCLKKPKEDVLISLVFPDFCASHKNFISLEYTIELIKNEYRYSEVIIVLDEDDKFNYDTYLSKHKNLRSLRIRREEDVYSKRFIGASEAIGDIVVVTSVEEVRSLNILAMIQKTQSQGVLTVGTREKYSLLQPLISFIGSLSGFRVSERDMRTCVYPRATLNQLLAHPDGIVALRYPPKDNAIRVEYILGQSESYPKREYWGATHRLRLLHRLVINSSPKILSAIAGLSIIVMIAGAIYIVYSVLIALLIDDVQEGWLTTSLVLGLITSFLGTSIFGLSAGLCHLLSMQKPKPHLNAVEERSSADIFNQVAEELNVEVSHAD